MESVRTSAFIPGLLGRGSREQGCREQWLSYVAQGQEGTDTEFALPSGSKILLVILLNPHSLDKLCGPESHLYRGFSAYLHLLTQVLLCVPSVREEIPETTAPHLVVPSLALDILEHTQPDLNSAANSQTVYRWKTPNVCWAIFQVSPCSDALVLPIVQISQGRLKGCRYRASRVSLA